VTTDTTGKFGIADNFTCPSQNAQVYVIANGGDAGTGDNSSTTLMAALGNCGNLDSDTVVDVSEVSSVAAAYALSPFMTAGSTAVGTSSTNVRGLVNAFATVANLVDPATGAARAATPAGNGIVPQTTINALANIIASCVDSKGDTACTRLFSLATPPGGTAPSDTLSALVDIAQNPGNNVAQLYALQPATQLFTPALVGAPNDWTLSVEYTGGGLNLPQLLAVDAEGNVWVPNAGTYPGTLSEFSPTGEPLSGPNGFSGGGLSDPLAVAVDINGNIWAANQGNGSVSEHTSSGTPLSPASGFTAAGMINPVAIAIDAAGDVFTANSNNTVTKLSPSGAAVASFTQGGLDAPYAVAIDASQNVWIANSGSSNTVSRFSNSGTPANQTGFTGNMAQPFGIAIDATGNAWVANFNQPSVTKLSSTGALLSPGTGYATPYPVAAIAVDGANTIWTANTDGSISHLSDSGVSLSPPATGYISADATGEVGIALDASGNVWTSDNSINSIFEYIGAAAPTVRPLQLAVKNKTLGQRP
jgi:sugar lactone lactonase YvrE